MRNHANHASSTLSRPTCLWLAGVVTLSSVLTAAGNTRPEFTSMPAVNVSTVFADGATVYQVTFSTSDADGYADLRDMRVIFNITESQWDPSKGRGYLAWGASAADITRFGGTWSTAAATGGGTWGYMTDSWGGTTYITPVGCSTATSGSESGATGYRTVTWTFQAKSPWAFNPLINDADAWVADYAVNSGWQDSPHSFDVVGSSCQSQSAMPQAVVTSNITATTVDVAINPADSPTDTFALRVEPAVAGLAYVQSDGSLGSQAVWQTRADWAVVTVTGLLWDTVYAISARALTPDHSTCPSEWGPPVTVTTAELELMIDLNQAAAFSPLVRGQNPYRGIPDPGYSDLWDLTAGSSARGLAGGLDADTYDWRDIFSGSNWGLGDGYWTTLQFLQQARDHGCEPLLTANIFGGGYKDAADGTFICQLDNPEQLAADWVRYTNIILQQYRQGDEASLTGDNLRIFNSITSWDGRDRLLPPGASSTPPVEYWEIGNEPELGGFPGFLSNHYLSPVDYQTRYQSMTAAMLAVDPSIKVGPCLMSPDDAGGSGQWLSALAAEASLPIDFVSYHPYYYAIRNAWGNPEAMTAGLREYKSFLNAKTAGIRQIMGQHNRTDFELIASEWNPMNWDATGEQQRSMAMAIGLTEGVFSFAEDQVDAAHFWERPQARLGASGAIQGLRDFMGNRLLASTDSLGMSSASSDWRVYVTRDEANPNLINIWGLNFTDDQPFEMTIRLSASYIASAWLRHYGQPGDDAQGGDTSLTDAAGMAWDVQDVTGTFSSAAVPFVLEDAEITVLTLELTPAPPVDFDRDYDVDQADFGAFQQCISGEYVDQLDPFCIDARLDDDDDVDTGDLGIFLNCVSGAGVTADPACAATP